MQDANIVIYQIFFTSLVWLNTLLKCESQDRRVHEPELDFFSKNRCSSNFLSKSNKMFQKLTRLFVPLKLHEIDFFLFIWSQLTWSKFWANSVRYWRFLHCNRSSSWCRRALSKSHIWLQTKNRIQFASNHYLRPHLLTWYCDFHCGSSLLYRFRVNFLFWTFSSS